MTQQRGLNKKPAIINHQRSIEQRRDSLLRKNSNLTGRQLIDDAGYATIDHVNMNKKIFKKKHSFIFYFRKDLIHMVGVILMIRIIHMNRNFMKMFMNK